MTDYFSEPGSSRTEIYQELAQLRLIDPHTHINPHSPASTTLADLLGYHYYTELARSAGMPKAQIEDPSIGPKELVERLVGGLGPIENTIQYSWLIEICRMFFGFDEEKLHLNNWEELYDRSESIMSSAQWPDMVLDQSNVEAVFLTNDFDDDLAGFDSDRYIPCLRTDDLVFHLADPNVRGRLAACTGIELDGSLSSLRASLRQRFEHFVGRGARACAISLPPSFTPTTVADGRASTALDSILRNGMTASPNDKDALSRRVFWTLAELCDEFGLPFDLMIGVNRKVYPDGVYQGQDLFDSRVSLIQYKDLFNTFPDVKFPVSVLASVTNQELVSYAWIFPNVYPNGHWWYSNTPSTIKHDLGARLDAVPKTKMIGYYSDAYKLEFVWPKFDMYRKTLASVLAEDFVGNRGWSTEQAVELGRQVLKQNTEEIFPRVTLPSEPVQNESLASISTTDSMTADPDRVDQVEMLDDASPSTAENLGAVASRAAGSAAAAAAAAVGLAAAEVFEEVITEDTDDTAEGEAELTEFEMDQVPAEEMVSAELLQDQAEESINDLHLEANEEVGIENETDFEKPIDLEEEHDDTFDTMVIEPAEKDEQSAGIASPTEASVEEISTEESPPPKVETGESGESGESDADEIEEDLGATIVLDDRPTELNFGDDSAGTVVEHPSASNAEMKEILAVEEEDVVIENSATEDLSATTEVPFSLDGEDVSDWNSQDTDEVSDFEDLTFEEIDEDDSKATIPVDLSATLDPIPDDEEIGELDLDDVELIDPVASRVTDPDTLSAEIDNEPLDVGDLLSADEGESASLIDNRSEDDSPLAFDSLTDEAEDGDHDNSGEAQIHQLTGDTSFAPDEESLQLKSDPMTGELNFQGSGDDNDSEEFKLSPSDIEPVTSTDDDDNDEFNLEWLNEDDD